MSVKLRADHRLSLTVPGGSWPLTGVSSMTRCVFFICRVVPLVRNGEVDNEPAKYLNRLFYRHFVLRLVLTCLRWWPSNLPTHQPSLILWADGSDGELHHRVKAWMASNQLHLNSAKTEVIWLGSSRRLAQCPAHPLLLPGASIQPVSCVRDLGIVVDQDLSLASHVRWAT